MSAETPEQPLMLESFPRAILHMDADAFFTSVEQAVHPELKGRPVVTGKERGIIACASYEAKRLGIKRGVPLWEARKKCPELVILPSDYETYSLYSRRLFDILRRFTPEVEESSIDEGFADLTGLRRIYRTSYPGIARRIQQTIARELDITVSIGLSLTKSLAKLASAWRKPRGLTVVPGHSIHRFLPLVPVEKVWGFGPNTSALLRKQGVHTAWDFVRRPEWWVSRLLGKVGREIHRELRGEMVYELDPEAGSAPQASLSKCKTFTSPSGDRDYVYARLVRNVESACIKLRRHHLCARRITVALRRRDFLQSALQARLSRPSSSAQEMLPVVRKLFDALYVPGVEYRATTVLLEELSEERTVQYDLFTDPLRVEKLRQVGELIDRINRRYGKHTLRAASTLFLAQARPTARDELPWRKQALLPGETFRRRVHLPRLHLPV